MRFICFTLNLLIILLKNCLGLKKKKTIPTLFSHSKPLRICCSNEIIESRRMPGNLHCFTDYICKGFAFAFERICCSKLNNLSLEKRQESHSFASCICGVRRLSVLLTIKYTRIARIPYVKKFINGLRHTYSIE